MANSALQTSYGFLQSTLSGDATFNGFVTGIFQGMAPPSTQPDWCILQMQASPKTLTAFGVVELTRGTYQVKVVGPLTDYANLYNANNRLHTLLDLVRTSSGAYGTILSCVVTDDLYYQETVGGIQYLNMGGLFRVEV